MQSSDISNGTIRTYESLDVESAKPHSVVFVHGFGSSPKCWTKLLELFHADPSFANDFSFLCYSYPTKWFNFTFLKRIPTLQEAASSLRSFLSEGSFATNRITLVGHSLGGLVIQTYLATACKNGRGKELANIDQVILIATPHLGSTTIAMIRKVLSRFFTNHQEIILRIFNPDTHEILTEFRTRVSETKKRDKWHWPIPVRCFWGLQDAIVPEVSARGTHIEASPLPGGHFSILKPRDKKDERFTALAQSIRRPVGHPHVFDIDCFEMSITVMPLKDNHAQRVKFGNQQKEQIVSSDNFATVDDKVTFSTSNRCSDSFKIAYGTRGNGIVLASTTHKNKATALDLGPYDLYGKCFIFKFNPQKGKTYGAKFTVYGGFDEGHRNMHFHFNKDDLRHYRKWIMKLDLSAYIGNGYQITQTPTLKFHSEEPSSCEECKVLPHGEVLPHSPQAGAGLWEWELRDIQQGVMTAQWDVKVN